MTVLEKRNVPLCVPELAGNAMNYLRECVDTNFVSSVGPFVDRFERDFAAYVKTGRAVAASNGTSALHIAMMLAGVGAGDEVLTSTFTFIATVNPIAYAGAKPVFIDSETETWNADPALAEEAVKERVKKNGKPPKALVLAHILGCPANIEPIKRVCDEYGVVLIEDAAEALGATYIGGDLDGLHVGTIGEIGIYSFNGNKIITSGGGGMLVCRDEKKIVRAKHLTTQAKLPGVEYSHDEIGYNYRLTNLAAALGASQLELLPEFLKKKAAITRRYNDAFSGMEGITLPPRPSFANPSNWLYTMLLNPSKTNGIDRRVMHERLKERGIETRPTWKPIHLQPMYKECELFGGSTSETIFDRGLSLPCSVGLTDDDQDYVIETVKSIIEEG